MVDALSPAKDANCLPVASGPAWNLLTDAVALLFDFFGGVMGDDSRQGFSV